MEIVPAIIAKDFNELRQKVGLVETYVSAVQLDIMDGVFAPQKTWDEPADLKNLKTGLIFEAHLMVSRPEKEIDKWLASGVKKILIHVESTKNLKEIEEKISGAGLEMGLALNLDTKLEVLDSILISQHSNIQSVQLMAIAKIGFHGQAFDERVIPKIRALRAKYPHVKIEVDGGINIETAKKATQAGADVLVTGSAIFNAQNIKEAIEELYKSIK